MDVKKDRDRGKRTKRKRDRSKDVKIEPSAFEDHADTPINDTESCWLNTKYECIVRDLQLQYGAGVKLLHSPQGVIQCIYFTTPAMQQAFNAIPQFLCIETSVSFKSTVIGQSGLVKQTVCLFLAEDGNGRSVIVSAGISTLGDNTRWLLETFKSCNPAWRLVRCVLAEPGPNLSEYAIKRSFIGAHLCCTTWQAARWTSKFMLPPAPVDEIYSFIDGYMKGEEDDQTKIRSLIGSSSLNRLLGVLDKANLTNVLHSGLEKVLNRFRPLNNSSTVQPEDFLVLFFDVVSRTEEDRKKFALSRLHETLDSHQSPTDTLTQYAYFLIQQQTLLAQDKINKQDSEATLFNIYGTSTQECSCLFGRIFKLPCRHILMLTSELKVKSHIPFELRWTVYHCLFGCQEQDSDHEPSSPSGDGENQIQEKQQAKHELTSVSKEDPIFCTSNSNEVKYIKAEPTSQPA